MHLFITNYIDFFVNQEKNYIDFLNVLKDFKLVRMEKVNIWSSRIIAEIIEMIFSISKSIITALLSGYDLEEWYVYLTIEFCPNKKKKKKKLLNFGVFFFLRNFDVT